MQEDEEKIKTEEAEAEEPKADEAVPEAQAEETEPKPEPEAEAAGTPPASQEGNPEEKPEGEADQAQEAPAEKTFTQSQVNELVGKARAEGRESGYRQARAETLEKYGVEGDDELDTLFMDGSRYGELSARYADSGTQLREAQTELALVKSGILQDRQGDVKAILQANGLDVTPENIAALLPTHPEWKASPNQQAGAPAPAPIPQPTPAQGNGVPTMMGTEPTSEPDEKPEDEETKAMRLFGF